MHASTPYGKTVLIEHERQGTAHRTTLTSTDDQLTHTLTQASALLAIQALYERLGITITRIASTEAVETEHLYLCSAGNP